MRDGHIVITFPMAVRFGYIHVGRKHGGIVQMFPSKSVMGYMIAVEVPHSLYALPKDQPPPLGSIHIPAVLFPPQVIIQSRRNTPSDDAW